MAGAPSSWRPPWFDRTTAGSPSLRREPGVRHRADALDDHGEVADATRSQSRSCHDRLGSNCELTKSDSVTAVLPSRVASPATLAKVMGPPRTKAHVHAGVADAVDDRAEPDGGRQREATAHVALPPAEHRGVDGDHQRLVALGHRPLRPCRAPGPRSRHTYTWNHFGPSLTAATSSMLRVAEGGQRVRQAPRAAAARATASSPCGSAMRAKPVGDRARGAGTGRPSSVVDRSTLDDVAQHAGRELARCATRRRWPARVISSSAAPSM